MTCKVYSIPQDKRYYSIDGIGDNAIITQAGEPMGFALLYFYAVDQYVKLPDRRTYSIPQDTRVYSVPSCGDNT